MKREKTRGWQRFWAQHRAGGHRAFRDGCSDVTSAVWRKPERTAPAGTLQHVLRLSSTSASVSHGASGIILGALAYSIGSDPVLIPTWCFLHGAGALQGMFHAHFA